MEKLWRAALVAAGVLWLAHGAAAEESANEPDAWGETIPMLGHAIYQNRPVSVGPMGETAEGSAERAATWLRDEGVRSVVAQTWADVREANMVGTELTDAVADTRLFLEYKHRPELHALFWKELFVRNYEAGKITDQAYDPDLGWDYNQEHGRTREALDYPVARRPGVPRIVVVGDSFTHGDQVDVNETFPAHLGRLLGNTEVLNMGISAYGTDQAVLKYLLHGAKYRPDAVVIGITDHDFIRSSLDFFVYAKPRYRVDGAGILALANPPILPPSKAYPLIRQEVDTALTRLARERPPALALDTAQRRPRYVTETGRVMQALVRRLMEETSRIGAELVVVSIAPGQIYATDYRYRAYADYDIYRELNAVYRTLGVPVVDLYSGFLRSAGRADVYDRYFVGTGEQVGHYSSAGNLAAAKLIRERLCALAVARFPACRETG